MLQSEYIRDRLIAGMIDKELSRDLQLDQETLTLERASDMARHKELVLSQSGGAASVNFIQKTSRGSQNTNLVLVSRVSQKRSARVV